MAELHIRESTSDEFADGVYVADNGDAYYIEVYRSRCALLCKGAYRVAGVYQGSEPLASDEPIFAEINLALLAQAVGKDALHLCLLLDNAWVEPLAGLIAMAERSTPTTPEEAVEQALLFQIREQLKLKEKTPGAANTEGENAVSHQEEYIPFF